MSAIRQLPEQPDRVETGPVQFGDDWPGVFIRGDDAAAMFWALKNLREYGGDHFTTPSHLDHLQSLLDSCNLNRPNPTP